MIRGLLSGLALVCLLCGCGPSAENRKVIERLQSRNIAIRMKAITEAEAQPNRHFKSELLRIFDDPSEFPLVKGAAGMALARMHDERILSRVTTRLPEALWQTNQLLAFKKAEIYMLGRTITAYGPGSLPALAKLLQHPNPDVVSWAIQQHGAFRRNDAALQVFSRYIGDKDARLRRAAAAGLSQLYHPGAEALIISRLADPDPEVRNELASALANYGTARCIPALQTQFARETHMEVKRTFALAIASVQAQSTALAPTRPAATATAKPSAKPLANAKR